jgi:hypothetical protein
MAKLLTGCGSIRLQERFASAKAYFVSFLFTFENFYGAHSHSAWRARFYRRFKMTNEEMAVVEKSGENLRKAIARTLGINVGYITFKRNDSRNTGSQYLTCHSEPISGDELGMMKYVVKNVRIGTFGRISDKGIDTTGPRFELHVGYDMQDGGSNGASMGIDGHKLYAVMDGDDWYVKIVPRTAMRTAPSCLPSTKRSPAGPLCRYLRELMREDDRISFGLYRAAVVELDRIEGQLSSEYEGAISDDEHREALEEQREMEEPPGAGYPDYGDDYPGDSAHRQDEARRMK